MTMDIWEEASGLAPVIQVQKFSMTTAPIDVKCIDMSEEMHNQIDRSNVGRVWRARIGRAHRWWYAWTAEEALRKALDGGGQ